MGRIIVDFSNLKYKRLLLVLISTSIMFYSCSKDSKTSTEPKEVVLEEVNAFGQNEKLGVGVNLGNALEAPNEGEWGVTLRNEFFQVISEAGFKSVRVPVRWSSHTTATAPFTISESFFERIDWVIKTAFFYDLMVIINIHHFEEFMENPEAEHEKFLSLWKQIGEHYKNYSHDLLFEVLNEPTGNITNQKWNTYLADAVGVIRESNPGRTIVTGSGNWSNARALEDLILPTGEDNIIVSFHYYDPFQFTHQGADWVEGADSWLGTKWTGSLSERNAIYNDFSLARNYGITNNVPVNVGEFGSFNRADMESRIYWTDQIRSTVQEYGFSCHYWEFCSGFGIYNQTSHVWYNDLVKALLPGWEP